jgi:hypothetical protein
MATLAQINDTLRDQTSSIEDGTKTTAGLKDRFGQFLDRQQGSGDKRENEIEARQKERRQRVMASRPTSFTQGVTQGLGFGGGLGFGAIAQKLLAGMGIAAGAIGLGAGKLLRFGPAIIALSDFGEKAIRGMVDYIDDEIEGVDFKEETKKRLTQGGQAAIAAKLLGAKGLFGPAIAGVIGAYGETGIQKFNEFFGKTDGKYNIPLTDVQIDTETQAFKDGLAIAAGIAAPGFLKFLGRGLLFFLKKIGAGRAAAAMGASVAAMLGIKNPFAASNVGPALDEIKKNKPPPKPANLSVAPLSKYGIRPGSGTTMPPANNNVAPVKPRPTVPFKFPQLEGAGEKLKNIVKGMKGFDDAGRILSKVALPASVLLESVLAQGDPRLNSVEGAGAKAVVGVMTSPLGIVDTVQNALVGAQNLVGMGLNSMFRGIAGDDAYQIPPLKYSNIMGDARSAINRTHSQLEYTSKTPTQMMIDTISPTSVLGPGVGAGIESAPSIGIFDESRHVTNHAGNMTIVTMGNTMDMGSKVVSIGKD